MADYAAFLSTGVQAMRRGNNSLPPFPESDHKSFTFWAVCAPQASTHNHLLSPGFVPIDITFSVGWGFIPITRENKLKNMDQLNILMGNEF